MYFTNLPCTSDNLELYLCSCFSRGLTCGTIRSAVSAISFYHKMNDFPDPARTYRITRLLRGIGKNTKSRRKLLPISFGLLQKLLDNLGIICDYYDRACLRAVLLALYYGCMRVGELVKSGTDRHMLMLHNVQFLFAGPVLGGVRFTLASYKHADEPATFKIKGSGSDNCPVMALLEFCKLRGVRPGPVFVKKNGKEYSRDFIAKSLKTMIGRVGLDPKHFNTHSFRIGRASDLAFQGVAEQVIKKTGRWESNAYTRYIRFDDFTVPSPVV